MINNKCQLLSEKEVPAENIGQSKFGRFGVDILRNGPHYVSVRDYPVFAAPVNVSTTEIFTQAKTPQTALHLISNIALSIYG